MKVRETGVDKICAERLGNIIDVILDDYKSEREINKIDIHNQPDKEAIIDILDRLMKIIYPGYFSDKAYRLLTFKNRMAATIEDVIYRLQTQINNAFNYCNTYPYCSDSEREEKAEDAALTFMEKIPYIREYIEADVQAAFDGDPAAASRVEVIMSYPGVYAISVYRIAHELHLIGVPMIPRIMTEHAHSKTGIDIHPGAVIGKYFFMDHGTGIVIGETTEIGDNVKVYQGVTLGALSTRGGQSLRGKKRHPTIGDNVTIYANCTILGGKTVIEDGVVVGGNSFIVDSIERGTKVSSKMPELMKIGKD